MTETIKLMPKLPLISAQIWKEEIPQEDLNDLAKTLWPRSCFLEKFPILFCDSSQKSRKKMLFMS